MSAPPECPTPAGKLLECSLQHFPLQGNRLGGSAGGTGSAGESAGRKQEWNRIRAAATDGTKHKQQLHSSTRQSSASDMPQLPVPTSTAMQDREGLYPPTATSPREKHRLLGVHSHTGSFWPWLWLGSSTGQLFQLLIASTPRQQSLPECVAGVFSAWCLPQALSRFQGQVDI